MKTTAAEDNFGLARICSVMGVSKVTFRKLVRDKIMPQEPDGKYNLPKCNRAWNDWKQSAGTSPKRQIEEQRARKLKRENDLAAGELVPEGDFRQMSLTIVAIHNMAMDAMPGRIAAVASMKEASEVEAAVRLECSACTGRIRDSLQELLDELKKPESSRQPEEESQDD